MENELEQQMKKALELAKKRHDNILRVERVADIDGKIFFKPIYDLSKKASLVSAGGLPFMIVLDNGNFRFNNIDEISVVFSLL